MNTDEILKACDPDDGKIHIRKRPDAAAIEPAYCGKRGMSTITEPWGYYGRGNAGFDQVCTECVEAFENRHRVGVAGLR